MRLNSHRGKAFYNSCNDSNSILVQTSRKKVAEGIEAGEKQVDVLLGASKLIARPWPADTNCTRRLQGSQGDTSTEGRGLCERSSEFHHGVAGHNQSDDVHLKA